MNRIVWLKPIKLAATRMHLLLSGILSILAVIDKLFASLPEYGPLSDVDGIVFN